MSELSPSLQQALDPEARERYDRQRQRNAWDSLASKPVHVGVDLAEEGQDATLLVVEPDGFYSNAVAQRIKQEDAQWTGGSVTPCAEAQAAAERQAQAV